jgi:hypothetical protein
VPKSQVSSRIVAPKTRKQGPKTNEKFFKNSPLLNMEGYPVSILKRVLKGSDKYKMMMSDHKKVSPFSSVP